MNLRISNILKKIKMIKTIIIRLIIYINWYQYFKKYFYRNYQLKQRYNISNSYST